MSRNDIQGEELNAGSDNRSANKKNPQQMDYLYQYDTDPNSSANYRNFQYYSGTNSGDKGEYENGAYYSQFNQQNTRSLKMIENQSAYSQIPTRINQFSSQPNVLQKDSAINRNRVSSKIYNDDLLFIQEDEDDEIDLERADIF